MEKPLTKQVQEQPLHNKIAWYRKVLGSSPTHVSKYFIANGMSQCLSTQPHILLYVTSIQLHTTQHIYKYIH